MSQAILNKLEALINATQTTFEVESTSISGKLDELLSATFDVENKVVGSAIIASGKKTDADGTDKIITTTGFNTVSIINDGPAELIIAVDESSLTGTKKIYIGDSEAFTDNISGTVLHYSIANDSCAFRYVLR